MANETDGIRCTKCGWIDGPCKYADCPKAEALPTLPVVAWRDQAFEDFAADFGAEFAIRSCGTTYADAQTHAMWCCWREMRAPAEAAIVALRAERDEAYSARDAAINLANSRFDSMRAAQAEVAELRKDAERLDFCEQHIVGIECIGSPGWMVFGTETGDGQTLRAAIDAARASLLGDGGTL